MAQGLRGDSTAIEASMRGAVSLHPFRARDDLRAAWQLVSTAVPFLALLFAIDGAMDLSFPLAVALALPAGALLLRLFILEHDCMHRSLFSSRIVNDVVGTLLGMLTCTPHCRWRREHLAHHASSGNLERRGLGDILTLTVDEYRALNRWRAWSYRVYRAPWFLIGIAPMLHFVIAQRFTRGLPETWRRERLSVHLTTLALVCCVFLTCRQLGTARFLELYLPLAWVASASGVFLFFVQHHYLQAYWRQDAAWRSADAALIGSSHLRLSSAMNWVTANIGLHHLHHYDPLIPNYRLEDCSRHHDVPIARTTLTLRQAVAGLSLALWDERRGTMIAFRSLEKRA